VRYKAPAFRHGDVRRGFCFYTSKFIDNRYGVTGSHGRQSKTDANTVSNNILDNYKVSIAWLASKPQFETGDVKVIETAS
jgi:hypothetical protein